MEYRRQRQMCIRDRSRTLPPPLNMFRFKGADVAYVCYKADSEAGAEATAAADTPRQNDQTPFVLVHGFGLSSFHWNRLAPVLAKASNRDVYAIDLLGFGKSAKTMPQGERLSTKLWGELIAAFAAEVCGGAYVVGNSIGSLSASAPRVDFSVVSLVPSRRTGTIGLRSPFLTKRSSWRASRTADERRCRRRVHSAALYLSPGGSPGDGCERDVLRSGSGGNGMGKHPDFLDPCS